MNNNKTDQENFYYGNDNPIDYEELLNSYSDLSEDNPTPLQSKIIDYIKEIPDDLIDDEDNAESDEFDECYPDYVGNEPRDSTSDFTCAQLDTKFIESRLVSYIESTNSIYHSPSLLELSWAREANGFKVKIHYSRIIGILEDNALTEPLGELVLLEFNGQYSLSTAKVLYEKYFTLLISLYKKTACRYYLRKQPI